MKRLLTPQQVRAMRKIRRRKYCAGWLIHPQTLRSLLKRRLIYQCGFYSYAAVAR